MRSGRRSVATARSSTAPLDDWNKIVELEPDDAASYIGRAKLWFARMEWDKAIDDLTQAIKLDPKMRIATAFEPTPGARSMITTRPSTIAIRRSRLDPENADWTRDPRPSVAG